MTITRLNAGDTILDRYEVKAILGEDVLGVAYLVNDRESNQDYKFKQLCFECDAAKVEAINGLVQNVKGVTHKSVANLYDLVVDKDVGYVSMEFIDGDTFEAHIAMRRENGQLLGVKAAYSFLAHLCAGIDTFHQQNLIFGALTPKNIYVTRQGRVKIGNIICPMIADLFLDDSHRNAYFNNNFVAPEVRQTRQISQKQSDVYSLALLFSELVSTSSFSSFTSEAETFIASLAGISSAVKEGLFAAVKTDASERFSDVLGLKESLKAAVDAPADNDLSSIVVGVADLRNLSASADIPAADASQVRRIDLFDMNQSGMTPSLCRRIKKEVWIFQKDGLDYGPFDKEGLLKKLYSDDIHEKTLILNTMTKEKLPLEEIDDFAEEVRAYLPVRDRNRAERKAREEKMARRAKGALGGTVALIAIGIACVILIPMIILMNMAPPEPLALSEAFPPFEKKFELPKIEEVALNVDDKQALALFDPKASAAEREAAFAAWEAEHRKKYASMRKQFNTTKKAGGGDAGDEIDTIVFGDEDGNELVPLYDWEVEEQLMNPRALRKQSDCFVKYANGRSLRITVNFVIQQTGVVRNLTTTATGELDQCLVNAFSSLKFRQFGGTVKRVSYPLVYN